MANSAAFLKYRRTLPAEKMTGRVFSSSPFYFSSSFVQVQNATLRAGEKKPSGAGKAAAISSLHLPFHGWDGTPKRRKKKEEKRERGRNSSWWRREGEKRGLEIPAERKKMLEFFFCCILVGTVQQQ